MTSPRVYRWAIGNPFTRWLARRRAAQLFSVMAGFVHSQVLLACVRLHVLEALREKPLSLSQLAHLGRMPEPAMQRLLHSALALGLVEVRGVDRYGLGPLGAPEIGRAHV